MRLLGICSASSKFYNYHVGASMHNAGVSAEDPVTHVISTVKSSGSMANLIAHPTLPNTIVATTKNGCEQWYIDKILQVLDEQLGEDQIYRLYTTLARTGWSLRCELLVRHGKHGLQTHGSLCTHDHLVVHGGTTREEKSLTPMDLVWLHREIGDGLLIPEMHVYDLNGLGMPVLEKAFEDANNEGMFGYLSMRNPTPPATNARHNLAAFYDNMLEEGATLLKTFQSHLVEDFDDPMVVEGFVQHAVTASSLEAGGEYHALVDWIDSDHIAGPYPNTTDEIATEPVEILGGWERERGG